MNETSNLPPEYVATRFDGFGLGELEIIIRALKELPLGAIVEGRRAELLEEAETAYAMCCFEEANA